MQTITENILNVTELEPREKHPTIFARFDELQPGESLTIHNDHDPKPLYYQLLGQRGNIFDWEYLEQGPLWFKIKISKRKEGDANKTLGELAAKDLRKAEVFKKYGLDFCCGGKKTVKEACEEKGIDVSLVERDLLESDKSPETSRPLPYGDWSLDFLGDYIINTHHSYVRKSLPDLRQYGAKVAKVHGGEHPELLRVAELIEDVNEELTSHMVKEERILFPFIKQLVAANGVRNENTTGFKVEDPIEMMEHEHDLVGRAMEEIRTITKDYTVPADGCASYELLFKLLKDFESDLFLHIHLENNVLFPKAKQLEKQLK